MKKRIAVIVRPPADAGRLDELRAAVTDLRARGHRVAVRVTFEAGDARRFARSAALNGWDVVVAAGGDGTINSVVNGLAAAERETLLGVVPLGTANDFARGLGISPDIRTALMQIGSGVPAYVDVARVNRRCFINVSTGGFGADATRSAGRGIKRYLGPVAYLLNGTRKLLAYTPRRAQFRVDGEIVYEGPFAFFAVGNMRHTGGGTPVTPYAEGGDGMLDVMLLGDVTRMDLVSLMPKLRRGTHLESPHVHYFRGRTFDVVPAGPVPVNADGESVAGDVFAYDLQPRGQRVVIPAQNEPGRPMEERPGASSG